MRAWLAFAALAILAGCQERPKTLEQVYQDARPSIVLIRTVPKGAPLFAPSDPKCANPPIGGGTGFVIDPKGYIVTNAHVVDPCPEDWPRPPLELQLADGARVSAALVGMDRLADVAVLKVERDNLKALELEQPDKVHVAQEVVALGYPAMLDGDPTFTRGVISALGRSIDMAGALVQTDTTINHGNSGGPLLNLYGRVVGMNAEILRGGENDFQGINFAISVPILSRAISDIRLYGKVRRANLGNFNLLPINEQGATSFKLSDQPFSVGILLTEIDPSSVLAQSLRACDVIEKINGARIGSLGDFLNAMLFAEPGKPMKIDYRRYPEGKCADVPPCAGKTTAIASWGTGCPLDPLKADDMFAQFRAAYGLEDHSAADQARIEAEAKRIIEAHQADGEEMSAQVMPIWDD
ncbi:MAG TPA: trypsin-like peptidase domain-containing protein [Caulobacterales bacterium]|nr:trypsin-like peptidase domain-containing protein [Caulobacterales bacterium]